MIEFIFRLNRVNVKLVESLLEVRRMAKNIGINFINRKLIILNN